MKDIIINIKTLIYNDENNNLVITNINNFEVDKLVIDGKSINFTGTITLDLLDITKYKKECKLSKKLMSEKELFNLNKIFIKNKIYSIKDIYMINIKRECITNNEHFITLKIESKSYYKEKNKKKDKKLKYPCLYKHFKGDIYCTKFISYPISFTDSSFIDFTNKYFEEYKINKKMQFSCIHTETNEKITIFKIKDKYYHNEIFENKNLVIYTCVNNIEKPYNYTEPIDTFLSEVDKEKYPDIWQKYRFEEA